LAKTAQNPDVAGDSLSGAPSPTAAAPAQQGVPIDISRARTAYSNFCRVTGTPEELVIDFGLNTQAQPMPTEPIEISDRIVLNYFTAKRLLGALHMSVQRHESAFGTIEVDVQKRVRPALGGRT
jgi:Protein of unknown function (DUF3467)